MLTHGGNVDAAIALYGGDADQWIDLSTGINPVPYPVPNLAPEAWTRLPTRTALAELAHEAARAYGTVAPVVPLAGASQAISLAPLLRKPGRARILGPTYNEHAAALAAAGWRVKQVGKLKALEGADLAVVVNPDNPTGRQIAPERLVKLAGKVRLLVVDESFADPHPELSLAPLIGPATEGIVLQRSFGKIYGLAGMRLGFAISGVDIAERLAARCGPWPVSGPAVEIGRLALGDAEWLAATVARLKADMARLDGLAEAAGWAKVGGTALFATYAVGDADAAQVRLARANIWSRVFDHTPGWLRLGLPAPGTPFDRLRDALS
ncbi:MAG: threonine-phosphate decarboxylase CobD [Pseudomonadota bacterium]